MAYLRLLFILILISACSGTKRIVESPQKEIVQAQQTKDSIVIVITEPINKTIDTIRQVARDTLKERPKNFNQILTKHFIPTHEIWDELLKKHVSDNGNVDYKGFKEEQLELYKYFKVLNVSLPNQAHTEAYALAYWINTYNAFTIDLILRNYPIKSIKDIKDPWDQRLWKLGDKWYNLNDIEHQILRKIDEPRIHFAIVCASFSCPKLQNNAFTAEDIDYQLTNATKEFLSDSNRNEISKNSLKLSKIFQWFSKDFKQNGSVIDFLNKYSDVNISEKAKRSFKYYDWALNE